MPGKLLEIPALIERFGFIVDAVQYHRDEGECLACLVAVTQGLRQKKPSKALALVGRADSQPGQSSDGQEPARQPFGKFSRQIAKIDLPRGQGVVSHDTFSMVKEDLGRREMFLLVLKG